MLRKLKSMSNPCVNAGNDKNHAKRATTQLGPRLGFWCTTCIRERKRTKKTKAREAHVARTYGLSAEDVEKLLDDMPKNKNGVPVCPGCLFATGASKALATDHDHDLEALGIPIRETVRGLLCSTCNQTIGKYGVAGLKRLIEYQINPPAPRVLDFPRRVNWFSSDPGLSYNVPVEFES
jgi:hypothetical protein